MNTSPELKKALKGLPEKRRIFVRAYLANNRMNATEAAIKAGYSAKTASQTSYRLLQDKKIQAAIEIAMRDRLDDLKVDADYVLKRLIEIDQMDAADILNDDGSIKPIADWPPIWRQMISGLDVQELNSTDKVFAVVKKIKWPDKVKNLELIGRHIDVQAFRDQVKADVGVSGIDALYDKRLGDEQTDSAG